MDKKQFDALATMVHEAMSVEAQCSNLKNRLKLAEAETKKTKEWKPVTDAAIKAQKPVSNAWNDIQKVFGIKEKDIMAMSMDDYKKKALPMIKSMSAASDAMAAYWNAYKGLIRAEPKLGHNVSANASFQYGKALMDAVTNTKIKFNSMK